METDEKLVYSAHDLADVLGICLPMVYQLMNRADFPTVKLGQRRRVVPRAAFENWLAQQAGQEAKQD